MAGSTRAEKFVLNVDEDDDDGYPGNEGAYESAPRADAHGDAAHHRPTEKGGHAGDAHHADEDGRARAARVCGRARVAL